MTNSYTRSEGFFRGHDDIQLFFQVWEKAKAQGTILITHGQGEHSEAYSRLISGMSDQPWNFYAWDLRGHGRSDGRRGYVAEFDDYCKDFVIFVKKVAALEKVKGKPLVLLCHSMGGLIQLKSLLQHHDLPGVAMVVSSPLLGIAVPVPAFKSKGAKILNSLLPQVTMGNEITNQMLTRDPDVIREFEQDALRHHRISSGAFLGFLESFEFVIPRAADITRPALFLVSDSDPVVSSSAARSFFDSLGSKDKEIFVYPNAKHEVFNDIVRNTVYADLKKYLARFLEK
jgi:alpha-beta hydrolase superfamily lysophospholipase